MKTLVLIASVALLLGFSFREIQKNEPGNIRYTDFPKFHFPSATSFAETVNNGPKKDNQESVSKDIDQCWYQKVIQDIQNEEYNITYSEELGTYQSPNRANNIRFIYHNNGFTAKTRTNKVPKFDVNDKTLKEEDKEYDTIKDFEIDLRITNDELQITNNNLQAAGNRAWIENENLRIDYTNTKEGMRQDFIIKQKPLGEGKLRLDLSAKTELKMIVGADALMFKNCKGEEKMKYSALKVWDANGKPLRAYFEKNNYELGIKNYESRFKNQKLNLFH